VFDQHPEWVEEAHRCGLKVNAWTTNKEEDLKRMRDLGVDFVTTDHPVEAIRLMKEKS
jgi:glycerophosphoryl diester phosphodiesterase